MKPKQVINTNKLPAPKGPYSQACRAGNLLFISGIIGVEPKSGNIAMDFRGQASQVLENLRTLLTEAGCSLTDVVKTTVFLAEIKNFPELNEIYAAYFPVEPPARSTVQAFPPGNFMLEIEAIALLPVE